MTRDEQATRKLREVEELARGWGKLLAEQAFPNGVGLEVDLFTMEEIAVTAAKALVGGAVERMTTVQARSLEPTQPCPQCGQPRPLEHRPRAVQVRGGTADLDEPVAHCSTCRRDFFPSAAGVEDRRPWL
jgi:hypothetical protein